MPLLSTGIQGREISGFPEKCLVLNLGKSNQLTSSFSFYPLQFSWQKIGRCKIYSSFWKPIYFWFYRYQEAFFFWQLSTLNGRESYHVSCFLLSNNQMKRSKRCHLSKICYSGGKKKLTILQSQINSQMTYKSRKMLSSRNTHLSIQAELFFWTGTLI